MIDDDVGHACTLRRTPLFPCASYRTCAFSLTLRPLHSPYIRIYIYIYACVSSFVDCQVNCHIAFSTRSTRLILILTFREFNTKEPNILPFSNNRNSFCLERYPSLVYNFKIYTSWYTPCECTLTVPPTKRERWQISRARSGPPRPNDDLRSV